jgi:hypothetical protein
MEAWPCAPFRASPRSRRFIVGLLRGRLRTLLPLNSVLPARSPSNRNVCAGREPDSVCNTHCMKITRWGRQDVIAVLGMVMSLVAALPAARAQIAPVSLVHETVGDSSIPSGIALAPIAHSELRGAVKPAPPKSFFVWSAGVYTAPLWTCSIPHPCSRTLTRRILWSSRFCGRRRRLITRPLLCLPREPTFWDGSWCGRSAGTKSGGFRR